MTLEEPKNRRASKSFIQPEYNGEVEEVTSYNPPVPKIVVRILNTDTVNGKVVVLRLDNKQAYLVPIEKLQYTVKDQEIDETVLLNSEQPYNFGEEFEKLYTDPQDLRIALWQSGVATQEQVASVGVKKLLRNMIDRGLFPIKESK